jgi:hypothetical protein
MDGEKRKIVLGFKSLRWFKLLCGFNGLRLINSKDDEYLLTPAG